MAIAPERLEVLSRLGIVKGGAADNAFSGVSRIAELPTDEDDAFKTLPAESSAIQRGLRTLADKPVLLFIIVCAITAAGAFAVLHFSTAPAPGAAVVTPAPVDPAGTEADAIAANTPDAIATVANTAPARVAGPNSPARPAAPLASRAPTGGTQKIAPAIVANRTPVAASAPARTQTSDPRVTASSEVAPAPPAILPDAGDEAPAVVDQAIYTRDNADVRPPRLVSEQLPAPAIGGWTTRTNAIEVLVSQDGSVEHARFVATPQRMPDMFVLSRAKMWKFIPALKDGQPVRYRLVLTWEVNP
jgi:hypothetical protein